MCLLRFSTYDYFRPIKCTNSSNLYGTERGVVDDESINGKSGDVMLHHALTVGLDRVLDVGHQRARNPPCHLHTPSSHFQEVEGEVIQGQLSADLNTKLLNIFQCSSSIWCLLTIVVNLPLMFCGSSAQTSENI